MTSPQVHVRPAMGPTTAVVLVLHGGKEHSQEASEPLHLSSRRMRPFARAIHRHGAEHGVAVWSLQYRVRGWNGQEMSPVQDARWALEQVRREHGPVPVVLLGHSMGGRTAVRVLDDPSVVAMVGLAPWLPDEPGELATGKDVLLVHGTFDRITHPRETTAWAERARPFAHRVSEVRLRRCGHYLLRRTRLWTDLAAGFALTRAGVTPRVRRVARQVLAQGAPSVTV